MDLNKLNDPFPAEDIEWRIQRSGVNNGKPWAMVLAYITSRAIMDRLDDVCGKENWSNQFSKGPDGGIICNITIYMPDGDYGAAPITKCDGAENTKVEEVKGGLSSAMKRAGVQWGIGRYLYKLTDNFAIFSTNGRHKVKIADKMYKWDPPKLPAWALPPTNAKNATVAQNQSETVVSCTGSHYEVVDSSNEANKKRAEKAMGAFANIGIYIEKKDIETCIGKLIEHFTDTDWNELNRHYKELHDLPEGTRISEANEVFCLEPGSMG